MRLLVLLALLLVAAPARADVRTYVLAIGNNQPLAGTNNPPLRYADDDAADVYTLTRGAATDARLLTVLDGPSQRRFPDLARIARPPTLGELRQAVSELRTRFESDRNEGHAPVLLFFFSGHGTRDPGPAALALLDGPLTQAILYDEILAVLPAQYVHLVVDACHAEAIVRPRDANAKTVDLSAEDVRSLAARTTLDRFPHVGAIVASSSSTQAHEWDRYERGVFTHEVVSGLRGGADIDGNGRIEYSELSAFLSAANRQVQDPRARLDVVVRPPALDRRAVLFDVARTVATGRLVGQAARIGAFSVEDLRGNRLADVNTEPGYVVSVAVPADETLFVRTRRGEAVVRVRAGQRVSLDELVFGEPASRARGALDEALVRGLFASPFGPLYYRGYVDARDELIPVPEPTTPDPLRLVIPPPRRRTLPWVVTAAGGGAGVVAAVFGVLALGSRHDAGAGTTERAAADAKSRFDTQRGVAIGFGAAAAVGLGVGAWMLTR